MEGRQGIITYTLANQIRILKGTIIDCDSVYRVFDKMTGKEFTIPKGAAFVEYSKEGES